MSYPGQNFNGTWQYANNYVWETAEQEYNVDSDQVVPLAPGRFVSSKLVLIAAGPPRLGVKDDLERAAVTYGVYPISAVENVVLTQAKPIQKLFEIGSELSYPIPGHWVGTLNLSSAFHYGPNILNVLYAYYTGLLGGAGSGVEPKDPARSGDWYLNLMSELFDYPMGLYIVGNQSTNKVLGSFYFEDCMVSAHQMGINSGMVVLTENVSIEVTKVRPVSPLIADPDIPDGVYDSSDQSSDDRYWFGIV